MEQSHFLAYNIYFHFLWITRKGVFWRNGSFYLRRSHTLFWETPVFFYSYCLIRSVVGWFRSHISTEICDCNTCFKSRLILWFYSETQTTEDERDCSEKLNIISGIECNILIVSSDWLIWSKWIHILKQTFFDWYF